MEPTEKPGTDKPRDPAARPGVNQSKPEAGHETSDVSIRPIVKFGIGLAGVTALVSLAMWGLFRFFDAGMKKREQPVPPMVAASLRRTPSGPRLEPDPIAPRLAVRAREDAMLATYGWVDPAAGVARIPIDRAMELLVERGLPPSKPMAPVTPVPAAAHRQPMVGHP